MNKRGEELFWCNQKTEKRVVRVLTYLYHHNRLCDFPTDNDTIGNIQLRIIRSVDYCYKRTESSGRIEIEMLNEMSNISYVILGYQGIENGRLTGEFNRVLFRFLIIHGSKYDNRRILKMLTKSRLLSVLSICIDNYEAYSFKPGLLSLYYRDKNIDIKDKNLLYMMTFRVCTPRKKDYEMDESSLTDDEIITGLKYNILSGNDRDICIRLRDKLLTLRGSGTQDGRYEEFIKDILMLHDSGILDIDQFKGLIEWHDLYKARYEPDKIDYSVMDLDMLPYVRSLNTAGNLRRYGGDILYCRVRARFPDYPAIPVCTACDVILCKRKRELSYP
ncbi:MAG: hypothetical protein K6F34_10470 [Lachnospiraceae bacterium]|nr:hypothetical protein [Lachnospiraceae bacterium]